MCLDHSLYILYIGLNQQLGALSLPSSSSHDFGRWSAVTFIGLVQCLAQAFSSSLLEEEAYIRREVTEVGHSCLHNFLPGQISGKPERSRRGAQRALQRVLARRDSQQIVCTMRNWTMKRSAVWSRD